MQADAEVDNFPGSNSSIPKFHGNSSQRDQCAAAQALREPIYWRPPLSGYQLNIDPTQLGALPPHF